MERILTGLRDWRTTVPACVLAVSLLFVPATWWVDLSEKLNAASGALQAMAAVVPVALALWNSRKGDSA